ncbi:MAG: hypothetical protein P4M09_22490 [Devosia sp.]|nr:hypothetical protein [Devosia sp.]
MSLGATFRRSVTILVDRTAGPDAAAKRVGEVARASVAELVRAGAASPSYRRFVDGVAGAPEETVRLDGGTITYLFSRLSEAAAFALDYAVSHSPARRGTYRNSWFLIVDGKPYTGPIAAIQPGAEVALTNSQPYHRKIDVGGQKMSVPPGIVEATRQAVLRKFGGIDAQRVFLTLPGGYVLKGHAYRSGLTYDKKGKAYVRRHARVATNRADSRKGEAMTYPALVMTEPA